MARVELAPNEVITGEVRLAFPSLFVKRQSRFDPKKKAYEATLLLPPDTDLSPYEEAIDAAMEQKWGKQIRLKGDADPIKFAQDTSSFEDEEWDDWLMLRVKADKIAPRVVGRDRKPILDKELFDEDPEEAIAEANERIFSGCWVKVYLRAFAWENGGKRGVTFGLESIQLIREDDRLGGRKSVNEVFDAYDDDDDYGDARDLI